MSEKYRLQQQVYDAIPTWTGKNVFDRALLGRIGDKKLTLQDEKDIAKHVPYDKKHKYLLSRLLTNPITMGIGVAAGAGVIAKYKNPAMRRLFEHYKSIENIPPPAKKLINPTLQSAKEHFKQIGAKMLRNWEGPLLKDPNTGTMVSSIGRLDEMTKKTPKQIRNSMALSGLTAAGTVAVGRIVHPKALMGEAILDKEQYHKRNPSAYIRTKLREDVQLNRGDGVMTKRAETVLEKIAISDHTLASAVLGATKKLREGVPIAKIDKLVAQRKNFQDYMNSRPYFKKSQTFMVRPRE